MGSGAVVYRLRVLASTEPGTVTISVKKVTAFFSTGSLVGTATAKLHIVDSKGDATITNGVLKLTKGTGALRGHSMSGKFSGTGTVNTGQDKITYAGTYRWARAWEPSPAERLIRGPSRVAPGFQILQFALHNGLRHGAALSRRVGAPVG